MEYFSMHAMANQTLIPSTATPQEFLLILRIKAQLIRHRRQSPLLFSGCFFLVTFGSLFLRLSMFQPTAVFCEFPCMLQSHFCFQSLLLPAPSADAPLLSSRGLYLTIYPELRHSSLSPSPSPLSHIPICFFKTPINIWKDLPSLCDNYHFFPSLSLLMLLFLLRCEKIKTLQIEHQ